MSTIALFEEAPVPVGFLLLAGSGPIESIAARDCLFMTLPIASASSGAAFLAERKHEEFSVALSVNGDRTDISGECRPGERLKIAIPDSGRGTWSISLTSGQSLAGSCEWAR